MQIYKNLIAGEWVESSSGETFENRNPANNELLGYFPSATVDDTRKRLLEAEMRAEGLAQQAEEDAERRVQAAVAEAKAQEERFRARIPDLHKGYIQKSEERAEQTIAELKRRYDERHVQLRNMAEEREEDALVAAFDLRWAAD